MTNLGFVDIETISLERPFTADPENLIWEVGLVVRVDIESNPHPDDDVEYRWFLPVNESLGDPESLDIGRFYERHPSQTGRGYITTHAVFIIEFMEALCFNSGDIKPHLVGNVTSFDEERLAALFYSTGAPFDDLNNLPWHYHIVDVEAFAAGRLGMQPPWKGSKVSEALRIPVPEGQHDALVDALWARDMYDRVLDPDRWTIGFDRRGLPDPLPGDPGYVSPPSHFEKTPDSGQKS